MWNLVSSVVQESWGLGQSFARPTSPPHHHRTAVKPMDASAFCSVYFGDGLQSRNELDGLHFNWRGGSRNKPQLLRSASTARFWRHLCTLALTRMRRRLLIRGPINEYRSSDLTSVLPSESGELENQSSDYGVRTWGMHPLYNEFPWNQPHPVPMPKNRSQHPKHQKL